MNRIPKIIPIVITAFFFTIGFKTAVAQLPVPVGSAGVTITQFAGNMSFPRGMRFGPDGYLYVAEAGTGGTTSTEGLCPQVPGLPGPGPWGGGNNGRVSKISPAGCNLGKALQRF